MASRTNSYTVPEVVIGYPIPPSSATPPPSLGWWSRPIVTFPAKSDREPTCKEATAPLTPCCGGLFTSIAIFLFITQVLDNVHSHAKFSIQSIAVISPSSTTWHVDFLIKNRNSRYSIYYGSDETAVRLGSLNAAVLNTSHERKSRSHTAFSVDFVAESNPNDVVFEELAIKLRATHKIYGQKYNDGGHIDIRCYNLTRSHVNVGNIQCHSSFTKLKEVH